MAVIGFANLGSTDRPEVGDPEVVTDLVGESNEAVEKTDKDKKDKANSEPDKPLSTSSTNQPVKDTKQVAPISTSNSPVKLYFDGKPARNAKGYPTTQSFGSSSGGRDTFWYQKP
jgi:hypothetical protein